MDKSKLRAWGQRNKRWLRLIGFVIPRMLAGVFGYSIYIATLPTLMQINAATGVGAQIGAVIILLVVAGWFIKFAVSPPGDEDYMWDTIDDLQERISKLEK